MLRRSGCVLTCGKIGWKEARKLVINSELKSTGDLLMPADEDAPMAGFSHWELMQTSLRFRLSRKPHGRNTEREEKKNDM